MTAIKQQIQRGYLLATGVVLTAMLLMTCGGRTIGPNQNDVGRDAAVTDALPEYDAASDPDASPENCSCRTNQPDDRPVELFHACTPPLRVGCTATLCDPGVTDCGPGYTCEICGAAACCTCSACVPACVFTVTAQEPLPEYLKLRSTYGTAGEEQELFIQGFPFHHIGALYYLVRVGDSGDLMVLSSSGMCELSVHAPALDPGMVPVWVSQYGGEEPWVLAGFYTYSGGVLPSCIQPGFECQDGDTCCLTPDVPMSCQANRCRQN